MTQSNLSSITAALPEPGKDALQLSEKLVSHIRGLISEQGGSISFDQYMAASLYTPGLGYYSAGSRKFGAEGDFVTAPEISSLFSRCLANQCAEIFNELGTSILLELGAGTGVMAREILLELEKQNSLPEQYWILEVSADLKQRQEELITESIPHLRDRIKWLDSLPDEKFTGVVLANEVLDALPVRRFVKAGNTLREMKVGLGEGRFAWLEEQADDGLLTALNKLESNINTSLPDTYVSEINLGLQDWLSALETILESGAMLFIDYGYSESDYYHIERKQGTLLCHYRHRVHADPFLYPGLQDITASVNFTALAEIADQLGLGVNGYTTQAYFLFGCGLESLLADMNTLDIKLQTKIAQEVRMLTMPEEMGERFQVMALTKNYNNPMQGFSVMDQRVRL